MTEEIEKYLEKSEQSIKAAELLLKNKMSGFSASRSYYAMFYVAEAILLKEGKSFSSHKEVISEFGRLFAKTGKIDPLYHQSLIESYAKRDIGDYEVIKEVDELSARVLINKAKDFLQEGQRYLEKIK